MKVASLTTPMWVVSTRTSGKVLTAAGAQHGIDLVLLGVPAGFTPAELQGWLGDLGGVAAETSRTDTRIRAIPALLHHALTGLLFSHAELWERTGPAPPCSAAFIDSPEGAAFGWVGEARVTLRIDGRESNPQWVRVRDDAGREAFATVLPPGVNAGVSIEYWPTGDRAAASPCALEAAWRIPTSAPEVPVASVDPKPTAIAPAPPAVIAAPGVASVVAPDTVPAAPAPLAALPDALPTQQPGLSGAVHEQVAVDDIDEGIGMPADELLADNASEAASVSSPDWANADPEPDARGGKHPVGRWLDRLMGWGRRAMPGVGAETARNDESAPLSVYDSLLSDDAPIPEAFAVPIPAAIAEAFKPVVIEDPLEDAPEPDAPEPDAPEPDAKAPHAAPVLAPPLAPSLRPVGLAELLLAAQPPVPAAPVTAVPAPAPQPEPRAFAPRVAPATPMPPSSSAPIAVPSDATQSETLPRLSPPVLSDPSKPIEVVHEPVGADAERFAIPQLPAELVGIVKVDYLTSESVAEPASSALELETLSLESPARSQSIGDVAAPPGMLDTLRRASAPSKWPTVSELDARPWHHQPWSWAVLVVSLFTGGWLLGHLQSPGIAGGPGPMQRALRAVGLGGAHFVAVIESEPPGAWIALDGKDLARRTPASIEVPPGEHTLSLTLTELGSIKVPVRGQNKDRITIKESLHGNLEILASDPSIPISVNVDRRPMGFAPVKMESIAPGLHEVQFSGPGMPAWAQTVQVGVRQTSQVVAHPITSPATGIIQVQAQLNDEQGASPLNGAQVFVDGELRGVTPTSLELPRGPHSLKLTWRGETAPVQVIDLPGGNQRFAQVQFGLDLDGPSVQVINNSRVMSADQITIISANLLGLQPSDTRESWLHVRASEGLWRRYPMTIMKGPTGAVVTSVFPANAFDAAGNTRWYISAQTLQGDEYFSEIHRSSLGTGRAPVKRNSTP